VYTLFMTDERGVEQSIEAKEALVSEWAKLVDQGDVTTLPRETAQEVLENWGAEFSHLEALSSLSRNSNSDRRPGMETVWGAELMQSYDKFVEERLAFHEERVGKPFPTWGKDKVRGVGMRHLLGDLTSYVAGGLKQEDFERILGVRARNGKAWEEGRTNEKEKTDVPEASRAVRPPSIPSGFASEVLDFLSKRKQD
jgi:uncharacterized protein with von Willebrand factor type A (vWA) domain